MAKKKVMGFNLIDLLCVALIIVMAVGVYIRFFADNKTVVADSEYYYTMEVKGIRQKALDQLNKSVNAPFTLDEKLTDEMGVLISVVPSDSMIDYAKKNGEIIQVQNPDRYDVMLTFRMKGKVNDSGYYTPGLRGINLSTWYAVRSKWTVVFGQVVKVWQN